MEEQVEVLTFMEVEDVVGVDVEDTVVEAEDTLVEAEDILMEVEDTLVEVEDTEDEDYFSYK